MREYFGDEPIAKEIFENKSREVMVPRINNDDIHNNQNIIPNLNNNHSNINLNNNNVSNSNSNILNHNDIQLNILAQNNNNCLIILFSPNKTCCFIFLFLCIIVSGLGTILIGFKNCSLYNFILGIIQFSGYYLFLKGINLRKIHYIFDVKINSFLSIYLILLSILFYLSSIYSGIFHNFLFFNPIRTKITKNKEKGICIIYLNLITGGLGTILFGFLIKNEDCFNRIKIWVVGLVQICGFFILILAFSLIGTINKIMLIILFLIGAIGYLTSIIIGQRCYKKISSL